MHIYKQCIQIREALKTLSERGQAKRKEYLSPSCVDVNLLVTSDVIGLQ